jgi:formamidopyrimidine-DNA glycosylase
VALETDDGWHVGFVDPRRFGSRRPRPHRPRRTLTRLLADLGPEPLGDDFNPADPAATHCDGKRTPIKAALLDQRNVAGLGNIYVCEALYRAGISPERLAGDIPARKIAPSSREIKATLAEAIAAGAPRLRDYVQPDGELGYFQHAWKVYGRGGGGLWQGGLPDDQAHRAVRAEHLLCPKCQK